MSIEVKSSTNQAYCLFHLVGRSDWRYMTEYRGRSSSNLRSSSLLDLVPGSIQSPSPGRCRAEYRPASVLTSEVGSSRDRSSLRLNQELREINNYKLYDRCISYLWNDKGHHLPLGFPGCWDSRCMRLRSQTESPPMFPEDWLKAESLEGWFVNP